MALQTEDKLKQRYDDYTNTLYAVAVNTSQEVNRGTSQKSESKKFNPIRDLRNSNDSLSGQKLNKLRHLHQRHTPHNHVSPGKDLCKYTTRTIPRTSLDDSVYRKKVEANKAGREEQNNQAFANLFEKIEEFEEINGYSVDKRASMPEQSDPVEQTV